MKETLTSQINTDNNSYLKTKIVAKNIILRQLEHSYWSCYFLLKTKKSPDGVEYIWKRHGSSKLIIVFSAMGDAKFNYIRSLKDSHYDQLYIRDCWASNASYYWFEGKQNYPEIYTQRLINLIISKGGYSNITTIGSSKGGTAAIYYAIKNNFNMAFAGACQYRVGDYLSRYQYKDKPWQWQKVVGGEPSQEWIDILDNKMADIIDSHKNSSTLVRLLYSTEEHTYPEHIIPLIKKLDENGISHYDQIEKFNNHSMIGPFFRDAIKRYFNE